MPNWIYVLILTFLVAAQIGAMEQMKESLEEIDIARFFMWTCIASVIAGVPIFIST